jgi:hypothetical protein
MENRNASGTPLLGIIVMATVAGFLAVICMGIFKTVNPLMGLISVCGSLFFVAWSTEIMLPDEVFMKLLVLLSGLGFMGCTMMEALFPRSFLSVLMIGLMAISMIQLIMNPLESSSPDS